MKNSKLILTVLFIAGVLAMVVMTTRAQEKKTTIQVGAPKHTDELSPEEVIRAFTEKESELLEQWKEFTYKQETKFQVLGPANTVSGEFYQLSEFIMNDAGVRQERILRAPQSTLDRTGLQMTSEDRNALVNLQPFALTTQDLPNYSLNYIGREKIDDINAYVFDVKPKVMSNTRELERMKKQKIEGKYFMGRIWVDDQDLQVVKTAGKTVPEFGQRFPRFETYRENIEGKYWFPTYTYADDTLDFEKASSYHVRLVVRYKDYKRFQGNVRIVGGDEQVDPEDLKLLEAEKAKKAAGQGGNTPPPANPAEKGKPAEKKKPVQ